MSETHGTGAPLRGQLTVLVVDDDPTSCALTGQILETLGYRVISATNGQEGLSQFLELRPDLVISDLMMPIMDGAEMMQKIKADNPAVPVIIMTVVDSADQAVRLIKSGADDYLIKPLSMGVIQPRIQALVDRMNLHQDVEELEGLIAFAFNPSDHFVLGASVAFLKVVAKIPQLARTEVSVLLYGESGTGKELVARAVHHASRRSSGPLITVSCANIPETLWEREFFGHVKGAFSDSGAGSPGLIEAASGGTLFLDEVGEIPLTMQSKLLRFLQEREYRAVGSTRVNKADVRVVSASNRDLEVEVKAGRFRSDLFYRLNVVPLQIPPLRQRKEDIPYLASHFLRRYARSFDKEVVGFSHMALQKLCSHDYPGNVRELENVIQQSIIATRHNLVGAHDVSVGDPALVESLASPLGVTAPAPVQQPAFTPHGRGLLQIPVDISLAYNEARQHTISQFEQAYVTRLLGDHDGNVSRAARGAGLPRKSLSRVMARHNIAAGPDGKGGRPGRPPKE